MDYNTKLSKNEIMDYWTSNVGRVDTKKMKQFWEVAKEMGSEKMSLLEVAEKVYKKNAEPIFLPDKYCEAIYKQGAHSGLALLVNENGQKFDNNIKSIKRLYEDEKSADIARRGKNMTQAEMDDIYKIKSYGNYIKSGTEKKEPVKEQRQEYELPEWTKGLSIEQMNEEIKKRMSSPQNYPKEQLEKKFAPATISARPDKLTKEEEVKKFIEDNNKNVIKDLSEYIPLVSTFYNTDELNKKTNEKYLFDYDPENDYKIRAEKSANMGRGAYEDWLTSLPSAMLNFKPKSKVVEKVVNGAVDDVGVGLMDNYVDDTMFRAESIFEPIQKLFEKIFKNIQGKK